MDIKCRIGPASKAFMDMKNVTCTRKISFGIRKHLFKCHIWSVLNDKQEHGEKA